MKIGHLLFIISMLTWPLVYMSELPWPGMTKPQGSCSSLTSIQIAGGGLSLLFYPVGFT